VIGVVDADPRDVADVAETLCAAFLDAGPVADWLVPDRAQRRRVYRRYFRAVAEHALTHGIVRASLHHEAVAIAYPSNRLASADDWLHTVERACRPHADRFCLLEQVMRGVHVSRPHEYLAYLAVRPDCRGRGFGTGLVYDRQRVCQFFCLPIHLVAPTIPSRDLYERLGFATYGPGRTVLAEGPALYPMRWQPSCEPSAGRTPPEHRQDP
jgi:GNAT superfamily N-acetyltransferase